MPAPVCRYRPSRIYFWAGLIALAIAGFSGWVALEWKYAWIAAGLSVVSSAVMFVFAFRPPIEVYDTHIKIGRRAVPWAQVRRLDRTSGVPLIVRLSLADRSEILILHAGTAGSSKTLLRYLRRYCREALIDGIPYRQFWGEAAASSPERKQPPPRYPLLLPQDEAEVERLFHRLKSVGHLDSKSNSEEK